MAHSFIWSSIDPRTQRVSSNLLVCYIFLSLYSGCSSFDVWFERHHSSQQSLNLRSLFPVSFCTFNLSAVGDTCAAMGEWVHNSRAETSLSNILPCVDEQTTNLTLYQSKEVIVQLVNVVNTAISSQVKTVSYNQSGVLMPPLCSPYDSRMHERQCEPGEVSFVNASKVRMKIITSEFSKIRELNC